MREQRLGQAIMNQGVLRAARNWKRRGIALPSWFCAEPASYFNCAELEENVFPLCVCHLVCGILPPM